MPNLLCLIFGHDFISPDEWLEAGMEPPHYQNECLTCCHIESEEYDEQKLVGRVLAWWNGDGS